jgi:sialate O-acetylesterase
MKSQSKGNILNSPFVVTACLSFCLVWGSALVAEESVAKGVSDSAAPLTLQPQCPPVFGDYAVFQQGIRVPVWGTSLPKATVTIRFGKQTKKTVTDKDGHWKLTLEPMLADKLVTLDKAPQGRTLTIVAELDTKRASQSFADILIGEVWLCSGQSNMAGKVRHNTANQDPNDDLMKSNLPAIRQTVANGEWISATRPSVGEFTRVGFCFARKVQREIKVPIGLINASTGGSRIESWMRIPPQKLPADSPTTKNVRYGSLYQKHIASLVSYGLRGALWYQGTPLVGAEYRTAK